MNKEKAAIILSEHSELSLQDALLLLDKFAKEKPALSAGQKPYPKAEQTVSSQVNDLQALYGKEMSTRIPLGNVDSSKAALLNALRHKAESYHVIRELVDITNLPSTTIASKIFEMTPKTLATYRDKKGKLLPTRIMEVCLKIKDLYHKGADLFIDTSRFNLWLNRPAYGLGNEKPIDFLSSSTGIDLIYDELVRIEFGATA